MTLPLRQFGVLNDAITFAARKSWSNIDRDVNGTDLRTKPGRNTRKERSQQAQKPRGHGATGLPVERLEGEKEGQGSLRCD